LFLSENSGQTNAGSSDIITYLSIVEISNCEHNNKYFYGLCGDSSHIIKPIWCNLMVGGKYHAINAPNQWASLCKDYSV